MTSPLQPPVFTLEADADTPAKLFETLAHRLFERLIDQNDVGAALREKVMVDAPDLASLLSEWVQVLLRLVLEQKMIFGHFQMRELKGSDQGGYSLRADAIGELLDAQRHQLRSPGPDLLPQNVVVHKTPQGYHAVIDFLSTFSHKN